MVAEPVRKHSKHILGWLGGLVAVYALLGFVFVPMLAKAQLAPFAQERLGLDVSVGGIALNPFTFTVSVIDLDFLDESGERILALDSATLNLQAMQFLRGVVSLRELTLDGLYIGVHRYADGNVNLASIAENFAASAPPASADTSTDEDAPALMFEIAQLNVNGASIGISDEVPEVPFITLVESIDFSLRDLSTSPQTVADQSFTLALGEGSQLRWRGDLSLTPFSSAGELHLFGPITHMAYRYFQSQIPVGIEGAWLDTTLNYELGLVPDGGFNVQVHDLQASLRDLDIVTLEDRTRLALLPSVAISGGEFNLLERRVQLARVQLDDFDILPTRFSDGRINFLSLIPESESADVPLDDPEQRLESTEPWDIEVSELVLERWQISARDEVPAQSVDVVIDLAARATNISNRANSPINIDTDISLQSGGALRAGGALTLLPSLLFDGEFALDELSLPVLQPYLESVANIGLESGRFALSGTVQATAQQSDFSGAMSLEDLAIIDRIQNEALFGISALEVNSATVAVGERNNIEIGVVRLREPYARVEIEADGSTNIGRVIIESEPQEASAEAASPEQGDDMIAAMLESIVIENASADFSDSSLPLPFAVHMDGLGGNISALSTQSLEPARVDLEGQVDEYGQVSINGRLRPLDYASLTEIDMFFRNLDIPSLSPYVIKFAGRRIAEGDLDVDLSYRINEGQLNGANSMVMRDLVLGERVPHPDALDLPLGLAIALLKDRNGVIDLDVPVTGELDNPQFSFGTVISRALGNIISNIVSSPFRFLANLVGGEEDADIGLIEFAPGRSDLFPPEREKLAKLGSALLERPQLQLGLTGVYAAVADGEALQESFFESRLNAALEAASAQPDAPQSPSALRMQVLEGLYLANAQDPAQLVAAQASLLEMQQQHSQDSNSQQGQVDTLAYSEALRRTLVAREPVSEADLAKLGQERTDSIEEALAGIEAQLTQRLQRDGATQAVALSEGRVPLALSLSALGN